MPVKSKESVGPCELSLDIEVEAAKVAHAVDRAYREFSKYIAVPGFRKGKAPMSFVRQRVPQDQLRERTAELLVGPAYEEALSENAIMAFARPKVELVKLETTPPDYVLEFKALVPLPPKVVLGEYKGIAADRDVAEVTEGDVDKRIESLLDRSAEYPLIEDRAAAIGDILVGELAITLGDGADGLEAGEFQATAITLGDKGNIPGVDDALVGLNVGDEKEFDLSYPDTYPNEQVAGKSAHFELRVKELHSKILPELNDEFAKKASGEESVEAMRAQIKAQMERTQNDISQAALEAKLVDTVVANAVIDFPGVLVDIEMEDDFRSFQEDLERRKITVPEYMEQSGQTPEQITADFRARADQRLRRGLALGELARTEKLELTDDDIAKEIESRATAQGTSGAAMRAYLDRTSGMEELRNQAYTRKLIGYLIDNAVITDKPVTRSDGQAPEPEEATEIEASADAPKAGEDAPVEAAEAKPKSAKPRKKKSETANTGTEAAE